MAKKEIVISCHPDGSAVLEGKGFEGLECNQAMASFEKSMGKTVSRGCNLDINKQSRITTQNV